MRKWLAMIAAAATLTVTACSGTTPTTSGTSGSSGVEIFGTVDANISSTR